MTRFYNSFRPICRIISISQHYLKIFRLTLFALITVVAGSCEKQVLKIGADILPPGDFVNIHTIDTLSIFSYTMFDDSVRTDHPSVSYLGQDYDPYFGTSNAGFVSQIRLSSRWDGLPYTVDSVKLYLHLLTTKGGGSDIVHSISIFEIANQIYTDSAYYSASPLPLTGFKVVDIDLPVLRTDTINDIGLMLPGNGVEFGNYLIRDTTKLFHSNSITDFRAYFKGLYFQLNSSSEPMLMSLSLVNDLTSYYNYFVVYGHDADDAEKDYSFILDAKNANAAFNRFTHDYTTATLGDKMAHLNTTFRDTLSYLQSLNGVYTKVSLPGLEELKNDGSLANIAINRARLVVPVKFTKTSTNSYLTSLPQSLRLRYKSSNGSRFDVPDYLMGASTTDLTHHFFDGTLDSVANVYNFNIPAFVQAYLEDATDNVKPELEIYQGFGTRNAILKANNNKTPVKFEFAYTKF